MNPPCDDRATDPDASTRICRGHATILNQQGLHMRPSGLFAKRAAEFTSDITLTVGEQTVDGKSSMMLVLLGAPQGTELAITATGPDAEDAVAALVQLVEERFGLKDTD